MITTKDVDQTTNNPETVTDIGFQRAQTFGCGKLYDATYPAWVFNQANSWFISQFGLDFTVNSTCSNGVPASGVCVKPGYGQMIPFANGDNHLYRIHSDKVQGKETKGDENWINFDTGYLVLATNDFTFPGGVMVGTTMKAGYILSNTYYNFLNEDDQDKWHIIDDRWREIVSIRTRIPVPSFTLSQTAPGATAPLLAQMISSEVIDRRGSVGSAIISVASEVQLWNGNKVVQSTRNVMTWGRIQRLPEWPNATCTSK